MDVPQPQFNFVIDGTVQTQGAGSFSFYMYQIRCRTNSSLYPNQEIRCERRYSDFVWLQDRLWNENKWCILPPVPEKEYFTGTIKKFVGSNERNNNELLSYRKRGLTKFLERLGYHPHLCNSLLLKDFLEMDSDTWNHRMKDPNSITGHGGTPPGSPGLPQPGHEEGAVTSFISSVTRAVSTQINPTPMGNTSEAYQRVVESEPLPLSAPVWESARHHVEKLKTSMELLLDRVERVVAASQQSANALNSAAHSISAVQGIEESEQLALGDTGGAGPPSVMLTDGGSDKFSGAATKQPTLTLTQATRMTGEHLNATSKILTEHSDRQQQQFAELLRFYCGFFRSVEKTLRELEKNIRELDAAVVKEQELRLFKDQQVVANSAKLVSGATLKLQEATLFREHKFGYVDNLQNKVRDELRRFDCCKGCDLREIARYVTELQRSYANTIHQRWSDQVERVNIIV